RAGGAACAGGAAAARGAVGPEQVLDGVAGVVPEIRVEVLLDEGSRLFVLRGPFGPGGGGAVGLPPARERIRLHVTNRGEHPIRVSSHFPFWRTNAQLEFDRATADGFRLDLPARGSPPPEPRAGDPA